MWFSSYTFHLEFAELTESVNLCISSNVDSLLPLFFKNIPSISTFSPSAILKIGILRTFDIV